MWSQELLEYEQGERLIEEGRTPSTQPREVIIHAEFDGLVIQLFEGGSGYPHFLSDFNKLIQQARLG